MKKEDNPGLGTAMESFSTSMDDIKVHYNTSRPAQLEALKYAQETDIKIAPGQEKHLPHELSHVVQQLEGRTRPQIEIKKTAQTQKQGKETK